MADVSMAVTDDSISNKPGGGLADQSMNSAKKKKARHRNRKLYSDILRQMEFYFSDANLQKDKFLQKKMLPEGWVEVDVFADFKKVKSITTDKRVLIRALSKSSVLELSGDGKKVRRKTPYVPPKMEEVDQRTIYLEPLPLEADHSYVTNLLKSCGGRILYVSLPRFKRSGQLKGFAFVEFDSVEAAEKACETFSPSRLPSPTSEVVGKFPQTNKQLESLKKRSSVNELASSSTAGQLVVAGANPPIQKRPSRNRTTSTSLAEDQQQNQLGESLAPISAANSNKFWVISKRKWMELKREYLQLQKQRISALKEVVEGKNPCQAATTNVVEQPAEPKVAQKRKQQPDQVAPVEAGKPKHIKFDDEDEEKHEQVKS